MTICSNFRDEEVGNCGDVKLKFFCTERPRGERRESVDFEDRNNHHPLLPSQSDQGTVGGSVWCGVAKESLSFCDGEALKKYSLTVMNGGGVGAG